MKCLQIHVPPPFSWAPQGVWQRCVCCSSPPYCLHALPMWLLGGLPGCFNFSRLYLTLIVPSFSTENVSFLLPDALSVGLIVVIFFYCVGYTGSLYGGWLRKRLAWKNNLKQHLDDASSCRYRSWISHHFKLFKLFLKWLTERWKAMKYTLRQRFPKGWAATGHLQ